MRKGAPAATFRGISRFSPSSGLAWSPGGVWSDGLVSNACLACNVERKVNAIAKAPAEGFIQHL